MLTLTLTPNLPPHQVALPLMGAGTNPLAEGARAHSPLYYATTMPLAAGNEVLLLSLSLSLSLSLNLALSLTQPQL
jgi:hypothetical protein